MGEGYLYAVDLGSGVVKVGRSEHPERRLKEYGCDIYSEDLFFVSPAEVVAAKECERRVCYLLRKNLSHGREYFRCKLSEAVSVIVDVCLDNIDGEFSDSDHLKTETLIFRDLPTGTKRLVVEAAKSNGHATIRPFFLAWLETVKVKK